jgi:plastocyanin
VPAFRLATRHAVRLVPAVAGIAALCVACGSSSSSPASTGSNAAPTTAVAGPTSVADSATSMPMPSSSAPGAGTATSAAAGGGNGPHGTVSVHIANFAFGAPSATVHAGDKVVVINDDGAPHTYEATDGAFSTGTIDHGQSRSFVAPKAGTYDLKCSFHSFMHGTLTVVT